VSTALKSRNDVLWFCLVLLVEVIGLSVALGGPWIEVSNFLLVVVSQTVAGAYIWAHLRKHEQQLPIPELLAMGFAIGSSSAAISQLILRDLLGIRLMISPYVPIIAVAIWLLVKRSPKLGVEITHTDSTTLLWLLFPAPLALTQYSYPTFIFFVIPFFIFAVFVGARKLELVFFSRIALPFIAIFSYILGSFINFTSNNGTGISRAVNNDSRFDVAFALGTAKWGVNSNLANFGQTESYYKLSYLWLGPIFRLIDLKAIDLIEASVPLLIVLFLGFAIWTLTQRITENSTVAGLSTVVIYVQVILPDSLQFSIRPTWLLGLTYLVVAASLLSIYKSSSPLSFKIATALSGSMVAVTRLSLVFPLVALVIAPHHLKRSVASYLKTSISNLFILVIAIVVGVILFSYPENSLANRELMLDVSEWPLRPSTSLRIALINTLCIAMPFCVAVFIDKRFFAHRFRLFLLTSLFLVTSAIVPRQYPADQDFLLPFLVLIAPYIALVIWHAKFGYRDFVRSKKSIILQTFVSGLFLRLLYDFYKLNELWQTKIEIFLHKFVNNGDVFALSPLIISTIAVLINSKRILRIGRIEFFSLFILALFSTNVGVFTATSLNPPADAAFNDETILFASSQLIVDRWQDDKILLPLKNLKTNGSNDDVVASNFGQGKDAPYDDDFRLQIYLQMQMYLTGQHYQILDRYDARRKSESHDLTSTGGLKYLDQLRTRFLTSTEFPNRPSSRYLQNMRDQNVRWFVVDLERTELRDWEPWATTRFINDKVAILELATDIEG
jgi:hypothetical protein